MARTFVREPEKLFTWWSYRSPDWAAADKGRRLDHIWVSPALGDRLASIKVAKDARGWARPSDHVPVTATLIERQWTSSAALRWLSSSARTSRDLARIDCCGARDAI